MITTKEIGKIFREKRQGLGLSAEEAGRRARIHVNVIKDIESGVFDRIGSIYLKSFMKKYSDFLGLDTQSVMEQYGSIESSIPTKEFNADIDIEEKEDSQDPFGTTPEKKLQIALAVVLSVVLVVLVFVLIGMMRARLSRPVQKRADMIEAVQKAKPVSTVKEEFAPAKQAQVTASKPPLETAKAAKVTLTLKAQGEVWLQLKSGEKRIFDGFMKSGDSKTWTSGETIIVWTGKADMLDFIVNNRQVGKVAAGVVRNIQVSSEGVRIGDTWVKRFN